MECISEGILSLSDIYLPEFFFWNTPCRHKSCTYREIIKREGAISLDIFRNSPQLDNGSRKRRGEARDSNYPALARVDRDEGAKETKWHQVERIEAI